MMVLRMYEEDVALSIWMTSLTNRSATIRDRCSQLEFEAPNYL